MKRVINILLLIIWLIVIFLFSNQVAEESKRTTAPIDKVVDIVVKQESKRDKAKKVVRKIAHFTEYCILALLIINVIKDYKMINYKWLIFVVCMCILYAISDEYHQSFIAGREPRIFDCFIDTCGSLFGIFIYNIAKKIGKKGK